jgi:hypothetical protein
MANNQNRGKHTICGRKVSTHWALAFLCQIKYHVIVRIKVNEGNRQIKQILQMFTQENNSGLGSGGTKQPNNYINTCCTTVMNNWAEVT